MFNRAKKMTSEAVMNTITYLQQKRDNILDWNNDTCPKCQCDIETGCGFQVCTGVGRGYSGSCPQGPMCQIAMHTQCAKDEALQSNSCPGCSSDIVIQFGKYTPGSLEYLREWNDKRMKELGIDPSKFYKRSSRTPREPAPGREYYR